MAVHHSAPPNLDSANSRFHQRTWSSGCSHPIRRDAEEMMIVPEKPPLSEPTWVAALVTPSKVSKAEVARRKRNIPDLRDQDRD